MLIVSMPHTNSRCTAPSTNYKPTHWPLRSTVPIWYQGPKVPKAAYGDISTTTAACELCDSIQVASSLSPMSGSRAFIPSCCCARKGKENSQNSNNRLQPPRGRSRLCAYATQNKTSHPEPERPSIIHATLLTKEQSRCPKQQELR